MRAELKEYLMAQLDIGEDEIIFEEGAPTFLPSGNPVTVGSSQPTSHASSNTQSIPQSDESDLPSFGPDDYAPLPKTTRTSIQKEVSPSTNDSAEITSSYFSDMIKPEEVKKRDLSKIIQTLPETQDPLDAFAKLNSIEEFHEACRTLPIFSGQGKMELLFGVGPLSPRLMVCGLFPSSDDIKLQEPWTGEAGDLLRKMLKAIGIEKNVCYQNWLCPKTLTAPFRIMPRDARRFRKILEIEIELVKPKVILVLGEKLMQILAQTGSTISEQGGKIFHFANIPAIPTHDPRQLMLSPRLKHESWPHLQSLQTILEQING